MTFYSLKVNQELNIKSLNTYLEIVWCRQEAVDIIPHPPMKNEQSLT